MTVASTALRAVGMLRDFCEAGVLESADIHVATRLGELGGETSDDVRLAVALAVRAVRHGSVCVDLRLARESTGVEDADEETLARLQVLEWPDPDDWVQALAASSLVSTDEGGGVRPLKLSGSLLYLDRYWRQESLIADAVDDRRSRPPVVLDRAMLGAALQRLFPGAEPDRQRLAAAVAAHRWISVLAGGPGTGKTTTVARLLAVLQDQPGDQPRVALCAPTGKAAARLEEAVRHAVNEFVDPEDRRRVGDLRATTIHRLLGWKPGSGSRFRHDRDNVLAYDVVVVDEASMVPLTLMARLVEALRQSCRLVLVGDPDQLASVEAGAVLGDLVRREAPADASDIADLAELVPLEAAEIDEPVARRGVVTLTRVHRIDEERTDIGLLARAINAGHADEVLDLLAHGVGLELVASGDFESVRADVVRAGQAMTETAQRGDGLAALAALDQHRVLCAHRRGQHGVAHWTRLVEDWLRHLMPDYASGGEWYVGRPILVTSNDPALELYNGDTGVVIDDQGQPRVAFAKGNQVRLIATNRLSEIVTVHAMSVHKSQGSEFGGVTVVLPEPTSPLLTKELFYTAVTRAQSHVRVVGTEASVRAAVGRRISRATGLGTHRQS